MLLACRSWSMGKLSRGLALSVVVSLLALSLAIYGARISPAEAPPPPMRLLADGRLDGPGVRGRRRAPRLAAPARQC